MRMKLVAVAGTALLLTGCAGEPTPAVTVVETVAAAPESTPTPTPTTNSTLALGSKADFETFQMTVHAVDLNPAPAPAPQPERAGSKWAAADVEYCSTAESTITSYWWRMNDSENRQYQASDTGYDAFPQPAYAWGEVPVAPNTCHRGWITFVVGADATLETVSYVNDKGHSAIWAIK